MNIATINSPATTGNGFIPCEGPRVVPVLIDFSLGSTFSLDLSTIQSKGWINAVQTVYVDNSANPDVLTIQCSPNTNQQLTCPPNSCGYYPVLQTNPPVLQFSTQYTGQVMVQLLNFYIAPFVWNVSGSIAVSDAILDACVTNNQLATVANPNEVALTDASGTLAAGNTPQRVLTANTARKYLVVSNPVSTTETLKLMFGSGTAGEIDLSPGMTFVADGVTIPSSEVWVNATTIAHPFTCYYG